MERCSDLRGLPETFSSGSVDHDALRGFVQALPFEERHSDIEERRSPPPAKATHRRTQRSNDHEGEGLANRNDE